MTTTDPATVTTGPIPRITPTHGPEHSGPIPAPPTGLGGRSRILVVDRASELADSLRSALGEQRRCEIVHLPRPGQLLQVVDGEGPWDAVVAGPTQAGKTALRRLADLREARPDLGLLVTVNGSEPADLKALVHARPDELVRLPAQGNALRHAVLQTLLKVGARRQLSKATIGPVQPHATIYAVVGPTGGSGKTMLALNLAYLLARRRAGNVVLADLDLQFGEVAPALQLRPARTIHDVLYDEQERPVDEVTAAETLAESLVPTPAGFAVLAAPDDPSAGDRITPDQLAMVIELLRTSADVIVLDTPTGLGESSLAALDHADHAVVVTQVDVPGVTNLNAFLTTLDQLGLGERQRSVVLNKELPNTGLTSADIARVIDGVGGSIPFDPAVTRALNAGDTVCSAEPGHPCARAIVTALEPLLPATGQPRTARKRRWRR